MIVYVWACSMGMRNVYDGALAIPAMEHQIPSTRQDISTIIDIQMKPMDKTIQRLTQALQGWLQPRIKYLLA